MERRRRPRALTLTLSDAEQPYLMLNGKKYALRNFSEEGIGLWMPSPPPYGLNKGNRINGDVVIGNHIHSVQLQVVRHSNRVMGFRITHQSNELRDLFKKLLEPSAYASEILPHTQSGQVDNENGHLRLWYTGRLGTELLVWYDEPTKGVQALQLCWTGKWVIRHRSKSPQTGLLPELERSSRFGLVVQEDELIVHYRQPDSVIVQQAAQFLIAVPPPLPGEFLWKFFETGEGVNLPEEFLQKIQAA